MQKCCKKLSCEISLQKNQIFVAGKHNLIFFVVVKLATGRVETCQVSSIAKLWTKTKVLEHLEEHEEDGQDEEVGYKGAHPPGGGEVGVVHHVDPVLQPNGAIIVVTR